MMDTKAAFEKWLNKQPICKLTGWCDREGDDYAHLQHTALWSAWQASRDAIEIDLENVGYMQVEEGSFYLDESSVEAVLTSHGIRIKGAE